MDGEFDAKSVINLKGLCVMSTLKSDIEVDENCLVSKSDVFTDVTIIPSDIEENVCLVRSSGQRVDSNLAREMRIWFHSKDQFPSS